MLQLIAVALIFIGTTPGPVPQKRVECNRGCYVYNDGGSWGITVDAGTSHFPPLLDQGSFPATGQGTRGDLVVGTDGGTHLYMSPGDGGAWINLGGN